MAGRHDRGSVGGAGGGLPRHRVGAAPTRWSPRSGGDRRARAGPGGAAAPRWPCTSRRPMTWGSAPVTTSVCTCSPPRRWRGRFDVGFGVPDGPRFDLTVTGVIRVPERGPGQRAATGHTGLSTRSATTPPAPSSTLPSGAAPPMSTTTSPGWRTSPPTWRPWRAPRSSARWTALPLARGTVAARSSARVLVAGLHRGRGGVGGGRPVRARGRPWLATRQSARPTRWWRRRWG